MARRKKSDDAAIGFFMMLAAAAAALLFGAAIIAPIILFVWWLYSEARGMMQSWTKPNETSEEHQEIERLTNLLTEFRESETSLYRIGDEAGIPRRGDNLFDGRFGSGRDVNNQLERLLSEIASLNWQLAAKQAEITARVTNWGNIRAKRLGARTGIIVYFGSLIAIGNAAPPWATSIGKLTETFGVTLSYAETVWFGASATAAIFAGLILLIVTSSLKTS